MKRQQQQREEKRGGAFEEKKEEKKKKKKQKTTTKTAKSRRRSHSAQQQYIQRNKCIYNKIMRIKATQRSQDQFERNVQFLNSLRSICRLVCCCCCCYCCKPIVGGAGKSHSSSRIMSARQSFLHDRMSLLHLPHGLIKSINGDRACRCSTNPKRRATNREEIQCK